MSGKVKLSRETYYDKVYGCWLGKNAGGTLGAPLESLFGKDEMFDIWWYPKLSEGGIPNDDLEIQLVWLQALRDEGIYLKAEDLAEYWLDCILYNYDEYGLHKTNLRLGLLPPVSGWYNNWFKHCMGSPIRSEIWACIAPGSPHIAARYAYQDSICDHAGGESVYGEVFNAVLESAAFLIQDRVKLVEIALSAIPKNCLTAKAIRTALKSYVEGLTWKEARERVKSVVYNPIAQYSPINLGFQTIGLLYGEDFGDAMCKAVNCGWDTDCTGATVGAVWGIMYGRSGLPKEWVEPLGGTVTVSRGIRNVDVPSSLDELTREVCRIGETVLKTFNSYVELCDVDDYSCGEEVIRIFLGEVRRLWEIPVNRVGFDLKTVRLYISYLDGPAILPDTPNEFKITIENLRPTHLSGKVKVRLPRRWILKPSSVRPIALAPRETLDLKFTVKAPVDAIATSNIGTIEVSAEERPALLRAPLTFIGGFRWLVSPVYRKPLTLEAHLPPERDLRSTDLGSLWKPVSWPENSLEVEEFFKDKPGVVYLRHFIYSSTERTVVIGVPNNSRMKLWLNGELIHQTEKTVPLRPNYSGDGSNYVKTVLCKGWNHVMIKLLREDKPLEAHFIVASTEWYAGMTDLIRCRFPWEGRGKLVNKSPS